MIGKSCGHGRCPFSVYFGADSSFTASDAAEILNFSMALSGADEKSVLDYLNALYAIY